MTLPSTTKSMPRARPVMSILAGVLLLPACASDTVPTGTSVPDASRPRLTVTPGIATCEGQPMLQADIDALLSAGTQQAALSQFAHVVRTCDPQDLTKSQALAFKLLQFTLDRIRQGQVENPGTNTSGRFYQLLVDLYAFVGLTPPTVDPLLLQEALTDGAVGVATPGQALQLVASSGNAALKTDPDFFVAPAIVILARTADNFGSFTLLPVGSEVGQQWQRYPPRYRIAVSPSTAQRNLAEVVSSAAPTTSAESRAAVAVCPGDFDEEGETSPVEHPETGDLRVARTYGALIEILPLSSQAIMLLGCTEQDRYYGLPTSLSAAVPTGFDLFATRARAVASRFAGALVSMVTPANLYAWDGGVGGRTANLDGDYEAAAPVTGTETGADGN